MQDLVYAIGTSSYTCTSIPIQHAAVAALEYSDEIKEFLKSSRMIFQTAAQHLFERFASLKLVDSQPDSAWYFFLNFDHYRKHLKEKNITTSQELSLKLIEEKGIIFVPGSSFGMPHDNLYLRASFVDFDPQAAMLWANSKEKEPKWLAKMLKSISLLEEFLST